MTRSEAIFYGNERVHEFITGMRERIMKHVPEAKREDREKLLDTLLLLEAVRINFTDMTML